jgi:hypothetical protein
VREGNRLTDQLTARLFRAYFVATEFGFAVCGRILASVSQFVATIRQATVATTPRSSETPRAMPQGSPLVRRCCGVFNRFNVHCGRRDRHSLCARQGRPELSHDHYRRHRSCQGSESSRLARFDRASENGANRWRNVGSGRGCRRHDPRLSWWLPWGSRFLQICRQRSATAVLSAHLRLVSTPGDPVSRSRLARRRWDPAVLGLYSRHDRLARAAAARGFLDEPAPGAACRRARPENHPENFPGRLPARSGKLEPRRLPGRYCSRIHSMLLRAASGSQGPAKR